MLLWFLRIIWRNSSHYLNISQSFMKYLKPLSKQKRFYNIRSFGFLTQGKQTGRWSPLMWPTLWPRNWPTSRTLRFTCPVFWRPPSTGSEFTRYVFIKRAVVVAQLAERSFPTPDDPDFIPAIGNFCKEYLFIVIFTEKKKIKKKRPGMSFKKSNIKIVL